MYSICNASDVILHIFKHKLLSPELVRKHRHTHTHIHIHTTHTALSTALWVLSVHNMAAIILLAAAKAGGG